MDQFETPGGLRIADGAVAWFATRSGGPGGQHANTSDTAVTITVHLPDAGLPDHLRDRLIAGLGETVAARAADSRSQARNRQLAWERLAERLDRAARPPRTRRPTRPSASAKRARLDDKRQRSDIKRGRQRPSPTD